MGLSSDKERRVGQEQVKRSTMSANADPIYGPSTQSRKVKPFQSQVKCEEFQAPAGVTVDRYIKYY